MENNLSFKYTKILPLVHNLLFLDLDFQQEKNLKAEEEQRRQQKERAEMEKLRLAEERKRFVFWTPLACVVCIRYL